MDMMDFSPIGPQTGGIGGQAPINDAIAKARQIVSKIGQTTNGTSPNDVPRTFEETPAIAAQLRANADQQRTQAAVAAASQMNAKLGMMTSGAGGGGGGGGPMGMMVTDQIFVPDRMVGLIIGKGGEQIASIQSESGCKIQFAPDSNGLPERSCTLSGSEEAVMTAKELISNILSKGQGLPDSFSIGEGATMVEMHIPGTKVGLIIGKGGETIKQLQERAGVKMVMIQDSNQPTHHDKPLRITGEPMRCQRAREMVMELLAEKDIQMGGFHNDFGSPGNRNQIEIPVPRNLVGVVIGKGGEMIKKIQQDTGARIQFKPDEGIGADRQCSIMGSPDKTQLAVSMIQELVQSALQRQVGGGMGRGRGRGRLDDRQPSAFDDRHMGRTRFDSFKDDTTFSVPSDKCGLVIGKGGETIREINRESGAHVELSRQQSASQRERVFRIEGDPGQIQQAIQMICEKAGIAAPTMNGNVGASSSAANQSSLQIDHYGGQFVAQSGQQAGAMVASSQASYPAQGWGGTYQQWNQAPSPADPNKANVDPTASAWSAYYNQYYNQTGQPATQPQAQQQQPMQQQLQQPQQPQQQQTQQQSAYPSPVMNPQTGQLDYTAAWAEYYRQQGMHMQVAGLTTAQQQH